MSARDLHEPQLTVLEPIGPYVAEAFQADHTQRRVSRGP
jgi:hypothetical protein